MEYTVRALDTRDRLIFEDGPFEDALTAKHVADDWAGTQALPTFLETGHRFLDGSTSVLYSVPDDMEGVVINRAIAYGNAPGLPVIYDTAALDLTFGTC